ncbi:hypothetical protein M422DRAFT_32639 [Sphaerobolus stellatus SS14]|uniref:Secreted protein n=1 Tax=Sphaerobolus stellatus (strain SS14) TaxID=990650 RepID=A0A0C9UX18_SPHS4|nr:hypothetical protein M422DRAFT_32639 [Sphaerobolus stellatus SS14]
MGKGASGPRGGHMLATLYFLFASFRLVTNVSQYPLLEPVRVSDTLPLTHLTTLRLENNGHNDRSNIYVLFGTHSSASAAAACLSRSRYTQAGLWIPLC